MPTTNQAINLFLEDKVLLAPAKAANAGGVATSVMEMSQNAMRMSWSFEQVDSTLKNIMVNIYKNCHESLVEYKEDHNNYVKGANIAAFNRISKAMMSYGSL